MSNDRDHWEALAEELGLPSKSKKSEPVEAPPSVARSVRPNLLRLRRQLPLWRLRKLSRRSRLRSCRLPRRNHATLRKQRRRHRQRQSLLPKNPVSLPAILNLDPPILDPMIEDPSPDRLPESDLFPEEPSVAEPERPRGRGGRRGQHGQTRRQS